MKGICFQRTGLVSCEELADPQLESDRDVLVDVELAGLCGSDLHPFWGREVGLDPGTVMGHEFVGVVSAVGANVSQLQVGDRVFAPFSTSCGQCYFCRTALPSRCLHSQLFGWRSQGIGLHGGQAEKVRVPWGESTLKVAPPELSDTAALLLGDNLSTGYFCNELADTGPGGTYAIIGCGTVGLLAILCAQWRGARTILAIDPVASRREQAQQMGVETAATPEAAQQWMAEQTEGRGADAVLELVGVPEAQALAYQLVRPGGTLAVIGCHCSEHFAFSPAAAYDKNLTYRTGRCPARHYMDQLMDPVLRGELPVDRFITHRFSFGEAARAYDVFAHRREGCLKAAFRR